MICNGRYVPTFAESSQLRVGFDCDSTQRRKGAKVQRFGRRIFNTRPRSVRPSRSSTRPMTSNALNSRAIVKCSLQCVFCRSCCCSLSTGKGWRERVSASNLGRLDYLIRRFRWGRFLFSEEIREMPCKIRGAQGFSIGRPDEQQILE